MVNLHMKQQDTIKYWLTQPVEAHYSDETINTVSMVFSFIVCIQTLHRRYPIDLCVLNFISPNDSVCLHFS